MLKQIEECVPEEVNKFMNLIVLKFFQCQHLVKSFLKNKLYQISPSSLTLNQLHSWENSLGEKFPEPKFKQIFWPSLFLEKKYFLEKTLIFEELVNSLK